MLFRSNHFNDLPKNVLTSTFDFLEMVELLLCASTSHKWNHLALTIANQHFQSYMKLHPQPQSFVKLQLKAQKAMLKELSIPRSKEEDAKKAEEAEKKLARRALYLLRYGANLHSIIRHAAEYGHPEIFTALIHDGFSVRQSGEDIVQIAAMHNQPAVIRFMDQNDSYFGANSSTLFDSAVVYKAVANNSAEVLQALGNTGIDFTESKNQNGFSPLYKALDIAFGESPEKMQQRFNMFEAMLKTGSFPKEGKYALLEWFSDRVRIITPHHYSDFFWMQHCSAEDIRHIVAEIEKESAFKTACQNLETKIKEALDKYEKIYLRCKKHVKKAISEHKKPADTENMTELTTYRKTLV